MLKYMNRTAYMGGLNMLTIKANHLNGAEPLREHELVFFILVSYTVCTLLLPWTHTLNNRENEYKKIIS